MSERFLGSEGSQASCRSAKGHLIVNRNLQNTPRDSAEIGEGKADVQGTGGRITRRHHSGTAGDWAAGPILAGGGSGREVDGGRKRGEGIPGKDNPGSDRD